MSMDAQVKHLLTSKTVWAAAIAALAGAAQIRWGWVIPPELQATVVLPLVLVLMRQLTAGGLRLKRHVTRRPRLREAHHANRGGLRP
jgi:hypothetical protein